MWSYLGRCSLTHLLTGVLLGEGYLEQEAWGRAHCAWEIGRNWSDPSASHRTEALTASTGSQGERPGSESPEPPEVSSDT